MRRWSAVVGLMMAAWGAFPGRAADPFYLGTWKIASAVKAPWADPKYPLDDQEPKFFAGKTMVFQAHQIVGPRLLACKGPVYKVVEVPAEGLFQGAFDEMRSKDKSVDPVKLAHQVGFRGTSWKSLQTGCANELDFHFVDPATAEFGLNDYVYTIRKQ